MRKPIITILALLIALSLVLASAEGINLIEQLRSSENKSFGAENGVYEAWYALLNKANGGNLPLNHWDVASTYISKLGIGEALSPEEQVFDQSLSAYEKYFLMSLTDATLSDEEGQALTTLFQEGLKNFPTDGQPLYITPEPETEAYMIGLMRQGTEMMGVKYALEPIDETTSLYAVLDEQGAGIISARKALTSLPAAMLMKHVPADKQQESAAVLARIEAAIPDTIDWKAIISGDDVDVENADWLDDVGLEEDDVEEEIPDENPDPEATPAPELTEEQQNELTAKWLKLLYACDAFDAQGDEDSVKLVTEALYAITAERPEVHLQPEGGISLNYPASMITPTPAPTKAPAASTPKPGSSFVIPVSPNYRQSYVIYVSKHSRTIAIIGKDSSGQFSKCLRKFSTGVGKGGSTRAGTFEVYKKERWRSWSGSLYSPYCTRIGPAHIHGPMYNAKNSGSMVPGSYNEIGTECSAGCLRTTCAAAAWVYYNCPVGTLCIIANDSRYKASKPKAIPKSQTWDPTDKDVEIPVTGITITPNPVRVKPKESVKLTLKLEPESSNTTKFSYESTDKSIATVDSEGRVTGVKIGKCSVKVTASDINKFSTTVSVEVIDPNSTPTPTPAPTGATPTPTPTDTPAPTATPAPDPEVLKVQTWLAILYPLDNVAIDGQNSDAVKAAVAKFQKAYNAEHKDDEGFTPLPEDGTLDDATKAALKAETYEEVLDLLPLNSEGIENFDTYTDEQKAELAIKQFQEAYNKEHTEEAEQLNAEGKLDQDDNKTVSAIQIAGVQSMLAELGKLTGEYKKGTMDEATTDAIKAFQNENNIEATGALDDATKKKIQEKYDEFLASQSDDDNLFAMEVVEEPELIAQSDEAPAEETAGEAPVEEIPAEEETTEEVAEEPVPLSGDTVRDAQTCLAILHWLEEDDIDGQFGGQTQTAVAGFQHSWNSHGDGDALPEDGELDDATVKALARAAKRRIAEVQELLAKLNLLDDDHVTGSFDGETKAAVLEFQTRVNEKAGVQRLSPTGKVDENTLRDLRGGYISAEQVEAGTENKIRTIDKDADPKDIAHVQKLLTDVELLEAEDFEEGKYDEATRKAVSRFQELVNEDNDKIVLEITGDVDEDTLEFLEAYAKKYREAKEPVEADAETPAPAAADEISAEETATAEPEQAVEEIVEAEPIEEAAEEVALEIVEEIPEPKAEPAPEPEPEPEPVQEPEPEP